MLEVDAISYGQPVDKRLAMYKNLRDQLIQQLKSDQQEQDNKLQMEELNKKILALEKAHSSGEDVKEPPRGDGAKGFLEGIKSYKVEDI